MSSGARSLLSSSRDGTEAIRRRTGCSNFRACHAARRRSSDRSTGFSSTAEATGLWVAQQPEWRRSSRSASRIPLIVPGCGPDLSRIRHERLCRARALPSGRPPGCATTSTSRSRARSGASAGSASPTFFGERAHSPYFGTVDFSSWLDDYHRWKRRVWEHSTLSTITADRLSSQSRGRLRLRFCGVRSSLGGPGGQSVVTAGPSQDVCQADSEHGAHHGSDDVDPKV